MVEELKLYDLLLSQCFTMLKLRKHSYTEIQRVNPKIMFDGTQQWFSMSFTPRLRLAPNPQRVSVYGWYEAMPKMAVEHYRPSSLQYFNKQASCSVDSPTPMGFPRLVWCVAYMSVCQVHMNQRSILNQIYVPCRNSLAARTPYPHVDDTSESSWMSVRVLYDP